MEAAFARVARFLSERRVAPESVTLAAAVVSAVAGVALAAGGAAGEPRLWLLVPSLGVVRLALFGLESRLVDCRPSVQRSEEHAHGHR